MGHGVQKGDRLVRVDRNEDVPGVRVDVVVGEPGVEEAEQRGLVKAVKLRRVLQKKDGNRKKKRRNKKGKRRNKKEKETGIRRKKRRETSQKPDGLLALSNWQPGGGEGSSSHKGACIS